MRTRALVAALAALSSIVVPAADATTRHRVTPSCKLLTDPSGDTDWSLVHQAPTTPAEDIVGGDMATGKKTVVMTIKLAGTNWANDPYSYLEYEYVVGASTTNGHTISFEARYAPYNAYGGWLSTDRNYVDSKAMSGTKFKIVGSTLKWTMPRSASPILSLPNLVFRGFFAQARLQGTGTDDASDLTRKYKDRYPSCVPAA